MAIDNKYDQLIIKLLVDIATLSLFRASANVGFGAYSADYSFFMDGGKESRARSRQAVDENMRCTSEVPS